MEVHLKHIVGPGGGNTRLSGNNQFENKKNSQNFNVKKNGYT